MARPTMTGTVTIWPYSQDEPEASELDTESSVSDYFKKGIPFHSSIHTSCRETLCYHIASSVTSAQAILDNPESVPNLKVEIRANTGLLTDTLLKVAQGFVQFRNAKISSDLTGTKLVLNTLRDVSIPAISLFMFFVNWYDTSERIVAKSTDQEEVMLRMSGIAKGTPVVGMSSMTQLAGFAMYIMKNKICAEALYSRNSREVGTFSGVSSFAQRHLIPNYVNDFVRFVDMYKPDLNYFSYYQYANMLSAKEIYESAKKRPDYGD
jgi:hypothetical protein